MAVKCWLKLKSDPDAKYEKTLIIDASKIEPQVTWGTSPEDVLTINSIIPNPDQYTNSEKKKSQS